MTSPMESQFRVEQGKLSDVLPDPQNANKHKTRGQSTLEQSLRKRGFFRPTAAFGKGVDKPVMGAGNLTQETAISIGMDDAIFVYSDGTKPIIHVRTDVAPGSKEAVQLALEDNRIAELSLDWDVEVLAGLDADVLDGLWTADELSDLGQQWADGYGDTSTERAKQGVGSTWGQVNGTDNVAVKIGEVETRLQSEVYVKLEATLNHNFSVGQKPFHETFSEIIEHGLTLFCD